MVDRPSWFLWSEKILLYFEFLLHNGVRRVKRRKDYTSAKLGKLSSGRINRKLIRVPAELQISDKLTYKFFCYRSPIGAARDHDTNLPFRQRTPCNWFGCFWSLAAGIYLDTHRISQSLSDSRWIWATWATCKKSRRYYPSFANWMDQSASGEHVDLDLDF